MVLVRIPPFADTGPDATIFRYSHSFYHFPYWSGQFSVLQGIPPFPGTRPDSTIFRYSHCFYHFSVLVRTVFRYSHGFHLLPIQARIQQFSGTPTDSTIFPNWSEQFFGTPTDSTFCRFWPGFNNFPALTLILPFFRTGPDSFSVLARIPPDRKSVV